MVNRDAYSKIANEYKNAGTYTWLDNEWINIDYGNNFTQKQKMVQDKDKLTIYFPWVEKVCTYKKQSRMPSKLQKKLWIDKGTLDVWLKSNLDIIYI